MRPWTAADLVRVRIPVEFDIAQDASECIYTLRSFDEESGLYQTKLRRIRDLTTVEVPVPLQGEGLDPGQLCTGAGDEVSPKFSPDGRWIAFLARRDENEGEEDDKQQHLYFLPTSGGEARRVGKKLGAIHAFAFSPTAEVVYVVADDEPSAFTKEWERKRRERKADVSHEEQSGGYKQVFVINLRTDDVTPIYRHDKGIVSIEVSPVGTAVLILTNHTGLNNDWDKIDIIQCRPLDDAAQPWVQQRLVGRPGSFYCARYSPDGQYLAYIESRNPTVELAQHDVFVVSTAGDNSPWNVSMAAQVHGDAMQLEWAATDRLWVQIEQGLYAPVVEFSPVSPQSGRATQVSVAYVTPQTAIVRGFALNPNFHWCVLRMEDAVTPYELYTMDTTSDGRPLTPTRLTTLQLAWNDRQSATLKPIEWVSTDGFKVEGVLAMPTAGQDGQGQLTKPPLILDIHGGPAWHATMGFHQYINFHWLTGLGFAVFAPNYRGSNAYGHDFVAANRHDLGGGDYEDIMNGVDAVLALGACDPDRMGVIGGSYGGYMTNWVIGHSNRFRAAVSEFGIWSLMTDFGCSSSRNWETMYVGRYWENESLYLERSPARYVKEIQTPVLIIHGDADDNTFIANSKEMYNALLEAGKTVEFVHYPREGHGIREPRHREDELSRIARWFRHYLQGVEMNALPRVGDWTGGGELKWRVTDVARTEQYSELGEQFRHLLAITVTWTLPEPTTSDGKRKQCELKVGDAVDNPIWLVWRGTPAFERPSVLAEWKEAPVAVVSSLDPTVLTAPLTMWLLGTSSWTLLFPTRHVDASIDAEWLIRIEDQNVSIHQGAFGDLVTYKEEINNG